ncbi:MAG: OmpA family protein [Flavobacteriales bacterium]|nr:OmpA family protein [Flavobacteriales bacterium]
MRLVTGAALMLLSMVASAQVVKDRTIQREVFFHTARWNLDDTARNTVEELCVEIRDRDNYRIALSGNTDSVGSRASNMALSVKRAQAVRSAFLDRGVADSLISVQGFSFDKPRADNRTEEHKQQNRRTQIKVRLRYFAVSALEPVEGLRPGATFDLKVLFKFNRAEFGPDATKNLDKLVILLKAYPELRFEILGWTAVSQSDGDLSGDRAHVVYDYLVAQGIAAERMRWKGMGGAGCPDHLIEQCRRVEIAIMRNPYFKPGQAR